MTVQAVVGNEGLGESVKVARELAGCIGLCVQRAEETNACKQNGQNESAPAHTSTSLSGPVLSSNFFASLSFMLKRSQFTPAARKSDV